MQLTKTVVGFLEEVVLVWIQLQSDTVLLVPDMSRRCGIIPQLHPLVLGQTLFALWKDYEILFPCDLTQFVPQSFVHNRVIFGHFLHKYLFRFRTVAMSSDFILLKTLPGFIPS
jgi:hypothetical protein